MTSNQSIRECRRDHNRYRASRIRLQKESMAAQEEMRKIRDEINLKEEGFFCAVRQG